MKQINVYDYDDERIDELCEKFDLMPFEVIEILLDNAEDDMFE